ncbi:MAG: RNA polymerase sigma factor (sigma-70 family) [Sphingobacteriales bacterium]|jgi:RNA polymerase sigma factor (sigma-70 family)
MLKVTQKLLKQCINNERIAQYMLYKMCFPPLMKVAMRYMENRDDAMAVVNAGFLKIILNLDKYSTPAPFEAWIIRIMINTIIDDFRKNKQYRENHDQLENLEDLDQANYPIDYHQADKLFGTEEILEIIKSLPNESRKVFNLFAIDGYQHKEIAELLNIKEGTSKWHVSFARKQIKEKMKIYTNNLNNK